VTPIAPASPALSAAAVVWAIAGWSAVLAIAIDRLLGRGLQALFMDLTAIQWTAVVVNALLILWAEGYRGFQRRFSPRAASRVLYLSSHATATTALMAPVFCVGLMGATPRILRGTWIGAALIVAAVIVVQRLPQPWRGIIDFGVAMGLTWGLVSFLQLTWVALRTRTYPADPCVPARPELPGSL
jgi:hypothetical protein